jgi:hypothetical protein
MDIDVIRRTMKRKLFVLMGNLYYCLWQNSNSFPDTHSQYHGNEQSHNDKNPDYPPYDRP